MATTFRKQLRSILDRAGREAGLAGSATVEAQHVLLAIAAEPATVAGRALASVGLDHRAIRDALDREFAHSLTAAGVSLAGFDLPPGGNDPPRPTRLAASVRLALERGLAGVRSDPSPTHLLLGILQAEVGTVARALALAGVDRAELMVRLRQSLANHDEG